MNDTELNPPPAGDNLPTDSPGNRRPEELPPVEPPSAGFIVQLFLIPALIVAAVIGVWALFGKMAESEEDWRQLVAEVGNNNPNRRWRAALGLAQIMRNQTIAPPVDEKPLAERREVAEALADLLNESLDTKSPENPEEELTNREFLARTLGALKVDPVVVPVLARAASAEYEPEVRKSSLMALAMIAGRNFEQQAADAELLEPDREYEADKSVVTLKEPLPEPTLEDEEAWQQIRKAMRDEDESIRHLGVFVAGLVSGPDAIRELELALLDGNAKARANAAVGLARNGSTAGFDVLVELMGSATDPVQTDDLEQVEEPERTALINQRRSEQPVILQNTIRAADSILVRLSAEQRSELDTVLQKVVDQASVSAIRLQAQQLQRRLEATESADA
ncbi:MAG: hypothetical protein Fues2KO_07970 [Fuerstiella sp.]